MQSRRMYDKHSTQSKAISLYTRNAEACVGKDITITLKHLCYPPRIEVDHVDTTTVMSIFVDNHKYDICALHGASHIKPWRQRVFREQHLKVEGPALYPYYNSNGIFLP